MRDVTTVRLLQLVVHVLNHHDSSAPLLSDQVLPLEGNGGILEYFGTHIRNALQDHQTRAGRFQSPDSDPTPRTCSGILNGDLEFVAGSRKLACVLFQA